MPNIYVTRKISEGGLKLIRDEFGNFEMNEEDRVLSHDELLEKVKGRDAVLCLLTDKIDKKILEAAGSKCKIFSNCAVGVNNIDIEAAGKLGIMVTNTPGVLTDATADLAIALLFACARRVVESDKFLREGRFKGWGPLMFLGQDLEKKTLGIIGAGRIGGNMAKKMAKGFQMKILYTDKHGNEELEKSIGAKRVDIDTLLKESDFISVNVNLTPETTHLIGEKEFKKMKPTCIFINTARGPVVDEKALYETLKENQIFAAGLDVYEKEPEVYPGLTALNNVILLPHIASATFESRAKMAEISAQNLIDALEGKMPEYCVNKEFLVKK